MNKKNLRQNEIISFIKAGAKMSVSDILSFLSVEIDRKTLQRDLKELEKRLFYPQDKIEIKKQGLTLFFLLCFLKLNTKYWLILSFVLINNFYKFSAS